MNLRTAIFIGATLVASMPAEACIIRGPSDGAEIGAADAVVIGRIANYRIVPGKTPDHDQVGQYAVFDVYVDRVLTGHARKKLTVKWDRWDNLEPDTMPPGRYVLGLIDPELPMVREPATGNRKTSRRPQTEFFLMQRACSTTSIYPAGGEAANRAVTMLKEAQSRSETEPSRE